MFSRVGRSVFDASADNAHESLYPEGMMEESTLRYIRIQPMIEKKQSDLADSKMSQTLKGVAQTYMRDHQEIFDQVITLLSPHVGVEYSGVSSEINQKIYRKRARRTQPTRENFLHVSAAAADQVRSPQQRESDTFDCSDPICVEEIDLSKTDRGHGTKALSGDKISVAKGIGIQEIEGNIENDFQKQQERIPYMPPSDAHYNVTVGVGKQIAKKEIHNYF